MTAEDITLGVYHPPHPPVGRWTDTLESFERSGWESCWLPDHLMGETPPSVWDPDLVLVATGEGAVLAEVVSVLHLLVYGLIRVAVIVLRRRGPDWDEPTFSMPGFPVLPAVGAVASLGLVASVQPPSIAIGGAVMTVSHLWY